MPTPYKTIKNNPIDPDYYETLAMVESSNNPLAKAPTSSAAGLYQFTEGTWNDSVKRAGLNYNLNDRFDPNKSRKVVEFLTKQNASYLKNKIGRKPTKGDLYLSHFLGMGGAGKILSADPTQKVSGVVSDSALKANKNVFYNKDGSLKTVGDIQNWARVKFNEDPVDYSKPKDQEQKYDYNDTERQYTEKVQKSTAVAQPNYERLYGQIQQQNKLLLEERDKRISEKEQLNKVEQAQAVLDQKVRERKFLEDLITQGGVQYVERKPKQLVYDEQPQEYFQDGGEMKPSPELEKYIQDLSTYQARKEEYYNPKKVENISSGDKQVDFLYKNDWLLDTPIVGDYIRDKAKEVATNSRGNAIVDRSEEVNTIDGYKGESSEGDELYNRSSLLDQYFSEEPLLDKSKYKPSSDYLDFLPSYSIKANFDKIYGKDIEKERFQKVLEDVITDDFIKNKKPIYKDYEEASFLSTMLGVDLGGHKVGAAWDKEKGLPYVSVSDAWDFEPKHYSKKWERNTMGDTEEELKENKEKAFIQSYLMHKSGNPFKIYDRFYFDPKTREYIPDSKL